MRPTDRSHAVAFLLTLGTLPLGCPADEGDDTNASNPSGSGSSSTTSTGTDSTGTDSAGTEDPSVSSTTSMTASSTTASTTESTDATDVSTGIATATGDDSYGTGGYCGRGIEIPQVCTDYAAHEMKCDPKYARYDAALECACVISTYGMMYGPECAVAYEDFYACLNALPCDDMGKDSCLRALSACSGGE